MPANPNRPGEPTNVTAVPSDDNSITVTWNKPSSGGEVRRYVVLIHNTASGKSQAKRVGRRRRQVIFRELENDTNGVTYRVSVQARNRTGPGTTTNNIWARSEWVTLDSVTLPPDDVDTTSAQKLVWRYLHPGEPTPPYAVGEPTQRMRLGASGDWEKYDPVPGCVIGKTRFEVEWLEEAKEGNKVAQANLASEPANILYQQLAVFAQAELDATAAMLEEAKAEAKVECEAKFPVQENLTQEDGRWVQVPEIIDLTTE